MATMTKPLFEKVMIIDIDDSESKITEEMLRIGGKVSYVYKDTDPLRALEFIRKQEDLDLIPDCIFLSINSRSYSAFSFLEEWKAMPEPVKDKCRIVLMSVYFKFQTELNQKVKEFDFINDLVAKPIDMAQINALSRV